MTDPGGRSSRRAARRLARAALVLAGTLLGLALLEVGLRSARLLLPELRGGARGALTILCVGDSHTYGLHVAPPQSYPARLQAHLDPTGSAVGVLNYGVPGRNSLTLLRRLPGYLATLRPDLVLIKVGFNDSWNFDGAAAADDGPGAAPAELRLVRLARLLLLRASGRSPASPPDLIERDGEMLVVEDGVERRAARGGAEFGVLEGEALARQVRLSLEEMIELVREAGATPVLLTYATAAQPVFRVLNESARALATRSEVALVDLEGALAGPLREQGYAALFFHDDHPTAAANDLIAAAAAELLRSRGLVAQAPASTAPAGAARPAAPAHLAVRLDDARLLVFEVRGEPGREFQVLISGSAAPPIDFMATELPIGQHPLLGRSLEHPNLRGRLDAGGSATVRLERAFLASDGVTPGSRLHAVACVFPPAVTARTPLSASAAVAFDL